MICPACAHENRPGAKFCEECAGALKRVCASCGAELRPTAKFCDECATPVAGATAAAPRATAAAPSDTRKVVTILFGDLVGSTALHERLDAESVRQFMESYYAAMRGAVEAHGGRVTQVMGDGVKAVFGAPRVAEDDAIRAVRAGVAMQDAFRALAEQQRGRVGATGLRVAVNTGEVVANDATEIIGDPVNVAARLQEQGRDGDVVVGESTHRLVATLVTLELLGSFALKGRSEAVRAYRVVSLDRPAGAATAPFVGRDEELARLSVVYDAAVEKPAAALAVLVGSPGLGKSRLIDEFARRRADAATVVQASCDAAGGSTFAPLAEALRELLGIEGGASAESLQAVIEAALPAGDADRARIASGITALLSGSPASPEETFFVVRRMLGALAQTRPVVLVIDDLHWAEPLLLDLVEHLVQWGSGVPLFVLIGARPELRDLRSSLVTPGGLVADVVTLAGLDAGAAMRLAANVIGAADLPAAVAAKVLATSEGNPLFVGELVRMLVQEGALTKDGDRWTVGANLAALEMPPTIHALLAARLERLRPEERAVLERAAVVGRHFSRNAIAALMPREAADLDARLEALRRSELIERDTGWLLGEPVLRFHHVLIRDAAYRRLLKGTRAELHAKLADWIEAQVGDAPEHDEMIGWHLEQAHAFLRELGPLDASGVRLGERAATRLAAAGRRALARDDLPVAADLLGRAIDRLDTGDPARADLALDWCEALLAAGDVGPAAGAIDELGRFTAGSDRMKAWHVCFAGQHQVLTAPSELHATADTVAAAADALTSLGDAAGEAKAHYVHALALSRLGKVGACEAALDRALAAARRAGDRRRANTVLAIAPLAALWGPSPVTRASGRCLDVVRVLRITQGAPAVEAVALSCQGVLEALRGRGDAARRMIASARKLVEELGITQRLLEADVFGGLVLLLEGDAPAAERSLRGAYDGLRELGLGIDAARAAALLARALLAEGRVAEAEALSHESESLAGDDLKAAIAWRGVRAEALAKRGEHAAAVEFASKAVELAAATDALLDHADARLALAAALRAAGRGREADAEEHRATELWEAKGATLLAERTAHAAAPVAAPVAAAAPRAAYAPRRRPVRPNFAFEEMRRAEAAVAARDARAVEALYRRDVEIVDHQFGITYGHDAIVERVRAIIEDSTESAFAHEPLASLGDSLALCRMRSTAAGSTVHGIPVGATEVPYLLLIEADEQGSARAIEIFGEDKLGESIARLYERYAALAPAGPERERAARAAFSLGTPLRASGDLARIAEALAPDFVGVDHRHLSNWSLQGAAAYVAHLRALQEVADDIEFRQLDVVALAPNAQLMRVLHTGTDRAGGGVYERPFLSLFATDAAGRLARAEWFDADREAEALARFEALTADRETPRSVQRRVRANAATAMLARFGVALAARDFDALAAHFHADHQEIDHPTGSTYGRDACIASMRRLFRSNHPYYEAEEIAALGEFLVLVHRRYGAGSASNDRYDVGAYENEAIQLFEVDERGLCCRSEVFAADRVGDAIVRLYERYADPLPEGAARTRAQSTARTVAVVAPGGLHRDGRFDLDAYEAVFRPDVEVVDHKLVSGGATRGTQTQFRLMAATAEVGEQVASTCQDVLALTPDGLLLRWLVTGVGREGGGAFEWAFLRLFVFDRDGRVARYELFEDDREAEALARFDALVGGHTPDLGAHPFDNAASRADRLLFDRFNARDWPAIEALAAPDLVFDERRRMVRNTCGREVWLEQFRVLFDVPASRFATELRATRGECLALSLHRFEGEVAGGGGPLAMDDHLALHEVDRDGRIRAIVLFDLEDDDAAYAELDARFAADPDAAHVHTVAGFVSAVAARDWDAVVAVCSPTFVHHDHRRLAVLGTTRGAAAWVGMVRALVELAPDSIYRIPYVRTAARGFLSLGMWQGSRDGGRFEIPQIAVVEVNALGAWTRVDLHEPEQQDQALARFAALEGSDADASEEPFANAASRLVERGIQQLWLARDWEGIVAMFSPAIRMDDRRRLVRLEIGYDDFVAQFRMLFDQPGSRWRVGLRATRGERLALLPMSFEADVADGGGPLALDPNLGLAEIDADGRIVAFVVFDLEDEEAAYAELDARFAADSSQAYGRTTVAFDRAIARRDWDAVAALCSPAFVEHDHRSLAVLGTTRGAQAWMQNFRTLVELAPDTIYRTLHARGGARGFLSVGTWLGSREGGRYEIPLLAVCEVDARGAIARADLYEPDQQEQALARFAELSASARAEDPFANAASAIAAPLIAAVVATDWARYEALFAETFRGFDRRRLVQLELDRDAHVAFARELADGRRARGRSELVATRGERLALMRLPFVFEDADVGPSEVDSLLVMEVDAAGRLAAYVRFDPDALDAAWAELDARFAAGEGAAHPVPVRWRRDFAETPKRPDFDALNALFAPSFVAHDHRLVGWGTLAGGAAFLESLRALNEMAPDVRLRGDHVRTTVLGALEAGAWIGTHDGGAFESPLVAVVEHAPDGRALRLDLYDAVHADRALARFAEVAAAPAAEARFANAAWRANRALGEASNARDLARIEALLAPSMMFDDRRRLNRLTVGREGALEHYRFLQEAPRSRFSATLLATRGERLALSRTHFEGEGTSGGGAFDVGDVLDLAEIDAEGRIVANLLFDLEDEDAAYAELDARFDALEAALHPHATAARIAQRIPYRDRDWVAFAATHAPDLVCHDHRMLGWGTLHGIEAWMRTQQVLVELAPDTGVRNKHLITSDHGYLRSALIVGTRDGGAFEFAFLRVDEVDAAGKVCRIDLYDVDRFDLARARFAELAAPAEPTPLRFENAASRAWRAVNEAWSARDLERFAAPHAAALRYRDHRRLFELDLDRAGFLDFTRPLLAMRAGDASLDLVATRGERLALMHSVMQMEDESVGPSVIESLMLIETDERGEIAAYDRWDLEDADAAWAEIEARWQAGEGAQHAAQRVMTEFGEALERRDWDATAACYAPDFVGHDHRLVGWGTVHGPSGLVRALQEMIVLAPDARMRLHHRRACARGTISDITWVGTRDGGAFESPFVSVTEARADGRTVRADFYDPHHLDRALARFAELRASERREGPATSVVPNLATAAMERNWTAFDALDLDAADAAREAARAHYAPDFVWDDRRPIVGLSGDLDLMLASVRERLVMGARQQRTIVGTAGDRVAIGRVLWAGGPADGRFEVEFLVVSEVNEAGLFSALIFFEPDDTRAAQREAWARWAAIDPAVAPVLDGILEITDAWNAHDRARLRACYAERLVVEDHRLAGIGRIAGVDAYVEANAVLWDLAPDQRIEYGWSLPAIDGHGAVGILRREGRLPDGGAFESEYVTLSRRSGDLVTHLEFFEPGALDTALARFEALRPRKRSAQRAEGERSPSDPLRVPPNAAARAVGRIAPLYANADLPALRAIVSDDFVFDDRTRGSLLRGGVEEWVNGLRFLSTETRARLDARLVATAGDRLALMHFAWQETPGESSFLIERFGVYEIDATGKLRAFVLFDAADRAAAHEELFERWVALGADGMPACLVEFGRALSARDLGRVRAVLADDFAYHDRRRTGSGRLDGPDAYLASPRAWWELSEDARIDVLYTVAVAPHGRVAVNRMAGTNLEGGAFESLMITVLWMRGDRIAGTELFEVDQLDAALARLEELRPDPLRIPPNAATRSLAPIGRLLADGDLDALRALVTDDFCFDDRTRRSLLRGGVEEWVGALQFLSRETRAQLDARLVATAGDRLALYHDVWQEAPGESRFRMESHRLVEIDAAGRLCALVLFDAGDRAEAARELADRYARNTRPETAERMRERHDARSTRDLVRFRALLPDDFVFDDRRRTGLGRIEGADAYVASVAALVELSADAVVGQPLYYLADEPHGSLSIAHSFGTLAEGGAFESVYAMISLYGTGDMIRVELFELEELEAAKARFEELRPDPLRIPPTAATRMRDRHRDAFVARDWDAMRALIGADFVYEDRGKRALVRGDVEAWIASMQFTTQPGFRSDSALIGTLGDRIVIDQIRWFGKPDGDAFEFGRIRLLEVGVDGLLRAVLFFDPEDRFAATVEGLVRFATGEVAGCAGIEPLVALIRALGDRSWEAVRECLAPDLILVDHRPLSFGTLDREQWIASLQVVDEISDGVIWEVFRVLAWSEQGFVVAVRRFGTIADGGGPFEVDAILTALVVDGRIQRSEIFGEADAERAVARFEALCAVAAQAESA